MKKTTTSKTTTAKTVYRAPFNFGKINYILIVAGITVMAVGMILMTGGHPSDPSVFNAEEKYSFVRISLAPIVIFIGLGIEVAAILIKPKDQP